MESVLLSINSITTKKITIINEKGIKKSVGVSMSSSFSRKEEDKYEGIYTVNLFPNDEKPDDEHKRFLISYTSVAAFSCSDPNAILKELTNQASNLVFPFLRANISSIMASAGIIPIILPTYTFK